MVQRLILFVLAIGSLLASGIFSCSSVIPPTTSAEETSADEGGPAAAPDDADGTDPDAGGTPDNTAFTPPDNSKTVVQLTDNDEDDSWGGNNFWSTTSRRRILWQREKSSGDVDVILGDTDANETTLRTVTNGDDVDFMALGSGAGSDDILASWREGLSETRVSNGTGSANLGKHNQEENSIADGCLFYRDSTDGPANNEVARYDVVGGNVLVSQTGFSDAEPVGSGCDAVWLRNGDLVYFNGASITPVAGGPLNGFDFREGKIVYSKDGDILLYDASASNPSAVNLTKHSSDLNRFPKTDGRFVAFLRTPNGGTAQEIVLYDLVTEASEVISTTMAVKNGFSLKLDLKQAIWMEGADLYFYDGSATSRIDPAPASAVKEPHMADGIVTWYGPTGPGTDNEIFIMK